MYIRAVCINEYLLLNVKKYKYICKLLKVGGGSHQCKSNYFIQLIYTHVNEG